MRDARILKHGLEEYRLLPTFEVLDNFEARHGSLMQHLLNLVSGSATVAQRATLIMEAAKASGDGANWKHEAVRKMMFELGVASEQLVALEIDLCDALLYTPEQYQAKKAQRAEAEKVQKEMEKLLDGFGPVSAPPPPS
jgi:hypothetical protein